MRQCTMHEFIVNICCKFLALKNCYINQSMTIVKAIYWMQSNGQAINPGFLWQSIA